VPKTDEHVHGSDDPPPQPRQMPEVDTPAYAKVVSDTWIIEGMMQIQHSLGELKADVAHVKSSADTNERGVRGDFKWTWSGIAAATIIFMGALIYGYFRLEDRQEHLSTGLAAIETKLNDLLLRVPPPPIGAPSVRPR
jgi:hypothetical protein